MEWIADRFFKTHEGWVDAATGNSVRVHISAPDRGTDRRLERSVRPPCESAPSAIEPARWTMDSRRPTASRRMRLARRFAFPVPAPVAMEHAAAFVRAAGVALEQGRCGLAIRSTAHRNGGNSACSRAVGRTLQPRAALAAIEDALDAMSPAGPALVHVCGASGAGLRTLEADRRTLGSAARVHARVAPRARAVSGDRSRPRRPARVRA